MLYGRSSLSFRFRIEHRDSKLVIICCTVQPPKLHSILSPSPLECPSRSSSSGVAYQCYLSVDLLPMRVRNEPNHILAGSTIDKAVVSDESESNWAAAAAAAALAVEWY